MTVNPGSRVGAGLGVSPEARSLARVHRVRLDRLEHLAALLHQHDAMVCSLSPAAFACEASSVDVGGLAVRVGRSTPLLPQASVPRDAVSLVIVWEGMQSVRLNGREARPHSVTVYGAGATHMGANHGLAAGAVITLNAAEAEAMLPSRPAHLGRSGTSTTLL